MAYKAGDDFSVDTAHGEHPELNADEFACALQAALGHGGEAYPAMSVSYDPEGQSRFELSTPANVGNCVQPDSDFSVEERASGGFPEGGPAQLTEVRTAVHDDGDRIVFEVPGEPIGWGIIWEDEPRLDPSGKPVNIEGEAYLSVSMTAAAQWADGDYAGPDRIHIAGNVATEAVMTSDFEGMTTWVIGLDDPQRLVLDLAG